MKQNQNGYKYVSQKNNKGYYNAFGSQECWYEQCYYNECDEPITLTNSIDQRDIARAKGGSVGNDGTAGNGGSATATNDAETDVLNLVFPNEGGTEIWNTKCCGKEYAKSITITNSIDQSTVANANGGSAGNDGTGGNGESATATNNAEANVYNVIVSPYLII